LRVIAWLVGRMAGPGPGGVRSGDPAPATSRTTSPQLSNHLRSSVAPAAREHPGRGQEVGIPPPPPAARPPPAPTTEPTPFTQTEDLERLPVYLTARRQSNGDRPRAPIHSPVTLCSSEQPRPVEMDIGEE
jgi:hypothetical protein